MSLSSEEELRGLQAAGRITRRVLAGMCARLQAGITTAELDSIAAIHEPRSVPNYFDPHLSGVLTEGMVITVEPIIAAGTSDIFTESDGWTVRTRDGRRAAHFENTIVVTRDAPLILTASLSSDAELSIPNGWQLQPVLQTSYRGTSGNRSRLSSIGIS